MDDGNAGAFSTITGAETLGPSTFSFDVTSNLVVGSEFRFMAYAVNEIGNADSNIVTTIAADVPATPTNGPGFDIAETNTTSIRVVFAEVTDNGGTPILSYHLQRTESGGSLYSDVSGSSADMSLSTEVQVIGLTKRLAYRFRYRAINAVGVSEWSPEAFLVPSVRPAQPPQPQYVSSDATQITLSFDRSPDDGGAAISSYELQSDASGTFTTVANYIHATHGFQYSLLASENSMTPGNSYRFRYAAVNSLGSSDYSDIRTVGLGALPATVTGLARSAEGNSGTAIAI